MSTYFISMLLATSTGMGAVIWKIWRAERKLQKETPPPSPTQPETIDPDSENMAYD